ncbi:MAG: MFS transporter [Actinomycetota bacterium]|nr:MFS transporter [Actinomycetota bacterium]
MNIWIYHICICHLICNSRQAIKKIGPRLSSIISAILFSSGYFLASLSQGNLFLLITGIGIISGFGIGFGYVSSLTTPLKWFPRQKGLITGISVAGFGAGAILLSQLVQILLNNGISILGIFKIISISYGIIVLLSALVISNPPNNNKDKASETNSFNIKYLLKNGYLWLLFYFMFSNTFSGLLIIGNLKPIGLSYGIGNLYATLSISFIAIGNSIGRVIWGKLTDHIGGKKTIFYSIVFLSTSILLLLALANINYAFLIISFLIGIGFGSNFVLYANEICNTYGTQNLENIYPSVHLSYGFAGIIAPLVGGFLFDATKTYNFAIILASAISIISAVAFAIKNRKSLF